MLEVTGHPQPNPSLTDALPISFDGAVMRIAGAVDLHTEPRFRQALCDAVDRPEITAVDLSEISFFGVAGVEPVLNFATCFRGSIRIAPRIDRTLRLLDVDVDALLSRDRPVDHLIDGGPRSHDR